MPGGGPSAASLEAALGERVPKVFQRGTHRASRPEETLARVAPLAACMGLTRLGDVTGLDRIGIPVTVAVRPNSRSFSVSQGKGLSAPQAFASALMEATELFHGEDLAPRTISASYGELSAEARAVDPSTLPSTGAPLSADTRIPWIEGYDLLAGEPCLVPWEIVHTDYTLTSAHSGDVFLSGTNGLASGNHLVEALGSALCELMERDAVSVWTARSIVERASCRLELDTVDDDDCRGLLAAYDRAGVVPRVWDVTSDIGVAAFVCDIPGARDEAGAGLRRFRGAGCHPDRRIALSRALTEAAQVRLTYIAGSRDDLPPADYAESAAQKLGAALLDAASQAAPGRRFSDVAHRETDDLALDLDWDLERLRAIGIGRVVAVDLTRPDFGIPVVRVVAPGLEWSCTHRDYSPGPRARRAAGRAP